MNEDNQRLIIMANHESFKNFLILKFAAEKCLEKIVCFYRKL